MVSRNRVVFINDVWLDDSSWEVWARRFRNHGFSVVVPRWPAGPVGLEDLTAYYARSFRSSVSASVWIGHGVGGLVAQRLLGANLGCAAVAIAPVPLSTVPWALPVDQLGLAGLDREEGARHSIPLRPDSFRELIANAVDAEEAARLFKRFVVTAPRQLLRDLEVGGHARRYADVHNSGRGPLLLISGQDDLFIPDAVTRAVYKSYGDSIAVSELKQFADRGHSLVIDHGWHSVADHVLAWLDAKGIRPR